MRIVTNFCSASSFYSVLFSFLLYWLLLSSVLSAMLIQFYWMNEWTNERLIIVMSVYVGCRRWKFRGELSWRHGRSTQSSSLISAAAGASIWWSSLSRNTSRTLFTSILHGSVTSLPAATCSFVVVIIIIISHMWWCCTILWYLSV